MKQGIYTIAENTPLTADIYRLRLAGDSTPCTAPGQFVNIRLPGYFLRRPISVNDWDDGSITVIYKILGHGTADMTALPAGTELDVLAGLGNGFDVSQSGDRPLIIGGGVGIPPLYRLAKELTAQGKHPTAVLGFRSEKDIFLADEFAALGIPVILATEDGSRGMRGFVTDGVKAAGDYTFFYSCGPTAMLRALDAVLTGQGQYSFEERMGCGFGACMGCTIQTKNGHRRVCADGPVFMRNEVLWS